MPGPTAPGPEAIIATLLDRFPGTIAVPSWGETALFHNPGHALPRGVYFATVKEQDGANDRASQLHRDGVFRFNLGLPKPLFEAEFGPPPRRPAKGGVIEGPWDFTRRDGLTPHPVYGWMGWVAVLTPSAATMAALDPLIIAAHAKATAAFAKRLRQG